MCCGVSKGLKSKGSNEFCGRRGRSCNCREGRPILSLRHGPEANVVALYRGFPLVTGELKSTSASWGSRPSTKRKDAADTVSALSCMPAQLHELSCCVANPATNFRKRNDKSIWPKCRKTRKYNSGEKTKTHYLRIQMLAEL